MINYHNILYCTRCKHAWKRRKEELPKYCPNCKTPYWNRQRRRIPKLLVKDYEKIIIGLHDSIIKISGGEIGVRDEGGIYFSVYNLLNFIERNPGNPIAIGTLILKEFGRKHHFIDGNKRTSFVVAKTFMLVNRCHLRVEYEEAFKFILKVAEYESKISSKEIGCWIKDNCEIIEKEEIESYINKTFVNLHRGSQNGD
jgi:death on curing protein